MPGVQKLQTTRREQRMTRTGPIQLPRFGMLATVRNRREVTAGSEPQDGAVGRLQLGSIDYMDGPLPYYEESV